MYPACKAAIRKQVITMPGKEAKPLRNTIIDWLKILVLLLDEAVVLILVILVLRYFNIRIPWPIATAIMVILGIFIFLLHKAVILSFRRQPASGSEAMIGTQGQVVQPLTPTGTITVRGERWKARSVDGNVATGENVEIVGLHGLTLQVKRPTS